MAQLLAPYNNSMRLGQGFNSYTQQICLDQAVLLNTDEEKPRTAGTTVTLSDTLPSTDADQLSKAYDPRDGSVQSLDSSPEEGFEGAPADHASDLQTVQPTYKANATASQSLRVHPWVKPQIVTYSSRFVDKLSDITEAMNISGSLSIKTATIGGKANGSYVDSDKFKSSDINFHLQVRVTNQIHNAPSYNVFNEIDSINPEKFSEVYGDSFISGWEEGGELNAIISVKVLDKSKIHEIKAGIEGEMTTPSISGEVAIRVDIGKSNLNKETETTMTVNWSGGGSIKNPLEDWTMTSLKKAAAAFPDLVAVTPQRTYAILTKYTALASFQKQLTKFSPLDYENAGIYTGALLDAYMDYKALWKQISNATYEIEANRATIEMGEPSEEIFKLAKVRDLPLEDRARSQNTASAKPLILETEGDSEGQLTAVSLDRPGKQPDEPAIKVIPVFQPSFAGLIEARKVCRFEMSKIVREVDAVAKDPTIATDDSRDSYFLNPLVFKQLLPVVRSLSPENAILGVRDPAAILLLGYNQPKVDDRALPPVYILSLELRQYAIPLRTSIAKVAHRAPDYRMQGCAGPVLHRDVHSQAALFNDLEKIDQTYRPSEVSVWAGDGQIKGISTRYMSGEVKAHGNCDGPPSHKLSLSHAGSEVIVEILIRESIDDLGVPFMTSLSMATSACNTLDTAPTQVDETQENINTTPPTDSTQETAPSAASDKPAQAHRTKITAWTKPDDPRYSFRGFFGFTHKATVCTLGVVWGKDSFVPMPSARIQPSLCKNFLGLSKDLQDNIKGHMAFAGKFFMGSSISTDAVGTVKYFNALDEIDINWQIKSIGFACNSGRLSGLKVTYHNGKELLQGVYAPETERWVCDVRSDLSIVKITAGKIDEAGPAYIDTFEFIREDAKGILPAWPLDLSTMRFLGEGDVRVSKNVTEVVESAPKIGGVKWSIRGFYGEESGGLITRLGVIWGRE